MYQNQQFFILSGMFSNILSKYFHIDMFEASSIVTIIMSFIPMISFSYFSLDYDIVWNIFMLISIGIGITGIWFYKFRKLDDVKYNLLVIHNNVPMGNIVTYICENPDFFKQPDFECNNPKYNNECGSIYTLLVNSVTYFTDNRFNVSGKIIVKELSCEPNLRSAWRAVEAECSSDGGGNVRPKTLYYKEMYLYVKQNKDISAKKYFELIRDYLKDKEEKSQELKIYYWKYIKGGENKWINTCIYKGKKGDNKNRKKMFIDSYFSPQKDEIWNAVKKVHNIDRSFANHGQPATANFLLYGPNGSGKSTLAARITKALGRKSLISLNITEFLDDKKELFRVIYDEDILNSVFLFEEFDAAIKYLKNRNREQHWYKKKLLNYNKKYIEKTYDILDDEDISEHKDKDSGKIDENTDISTDSSHVVISDLLELFQGPCPIDGMIIFATTNDFEYIKNNHEQLIRPGRLTPMYIGYMDWIRLQELCRYYFKKETKLEPFEITYQTSGIILFALEALNYPDPLKHFEYKLCKVHNKECK